MKDLVKIIAENICDQPDRIQIEEVETNSASIIEVSVAKEDLGKMIGKNGKTAQAIRTLIYASSFKYNKRYSLEIIAES
jgi:predicted RNA-binding protein YlqC (UPF0109 family)